MGYLPIFTRRAISLLEYRHQLSRSWKRNGGGNRKIGWAMNVDEMKLWWNNSWKVRIACFLVYSRNQFFIYHQPLRSCIYLAIFVETGDITIRNPEENVSLGLLMLLPPFICMVCPVLPSCLFKLILNVLDVTNRLSLRRTSLIGKPRLAVSSWCAVRAAPPRSTGPRRLATKIPRWGIMREPAEPEYMNAGKWGPGPG